MGLDCSHNAWHGAYSAFMRWRSKISEVAGLPPLELMEGFYESFSCDKLPTLYHGKGTRDPEGYLKNIDSLLPIQWDCLAPSPLYELLYHSDCGGSIKSEHCESIACKLEELIPLLPDEEDGGLFGNWKNKTRQFVDVLRSAAAAKEDLDFG